MTRARGKSLINTTVRQGKRWPRVPQNSEGLRRVTLRMVCVVVVGLAATTGIAQDFEAFEPPGLLPPAGGMAALAQAGQPEWQFGFQLFHLLLEQKGLYAVSDFREPMDQRPGQTAVVLVGHLNEVPTDLRSRLTTFLASGGIVLVASDESAFFRNLFMLRQGPFEVTADQQAYQGFRDCPIVQDFRVRTPVLDGVSRLVANRTGVIARMDNRLGNWSIVAQLPNVSDGVNRARSGMPLIAEMTSRVRGGGKLMLVADHSMLINGMLWHGDNARLAVNLADWLSGSDRKEVAFIVDGEPVEALLVSPPELPDELPPLEDLPVPTLKELAGLPKETLLRFANRFVAGMEDADVLNEILAEQPSDMPAPRYRQSLFLAIGILSAVYILRLMGRTGQRLPASPPRAVGYDSSRDPTPVLSTGEVQMAGCELAQDAMRRLTGSSDPLDWAIPVRDFEIDAGWIRQISIRENLKTLKSLASNSARTSMSARDLRKLAKQIAIITGMKDEGRLRHPSISA